MRYPEECVETQKHPYGASMCLSNPSVETFGTKGGTTPMYTASIGELPSQSAVTRDLSKDIMDGRICSRTFRSKIKQIIEQLQNLGVGDRE